MDIRALSSLIQRLDDDHDGHDVDIDTDDDVDDRGGVDVLIRTFSKINFWFQNYNFNLWVLSNNIECKIVLNHSQSIQDYLTVCVCSTVPTILGGGGGGGG